MKISNVFKIFPINFIVIVMTIDVAEALVGEISTDERDMIGEMIFVIMIKIVATMTEIMIGVMIVVGIEETVQDVRHFNIGK